MADVVNSEGVPLPLLGRGCEYIPEMKEDGTPTVWAAVITEVLDAQAMSVRVTAFPPGEPPRGILASVAWRSVDAPEANTWRWPS